MTEPPLTATRTGGVLVPACPEGRHTEHDGLTCADADTLRHADPRALAAAVDRAIHAHTREATRA